MARRSRTLNASQAAEFIMNYDSKENDELIDCEVDLDESTDSENELNVDQPQPSTSGGRNRENLTQTRQRGGRGRPSSHTASASNDSEWSSGQFDPPAVTFTGQPGMKVTVENPTPLEYFKLFLSDDILQILVDETNRYAQQCEDASPRPFTKYSVFNTWTRVSFQEMRVFLGLLLNMGLVVKPEIRSYWSTEPAIATPFFNQCMSRNRFEEILQFLHLADNTHQPAQTDPNRDKLFKIRPYLDFFTKACKESYSPKQNLAVDESIMPWKGRLAFRQYIQNKPIKYGIKMYFACESGSGYISRLKIYCGKQGNAVEKDHGGNVVRELTSDFHGFGHTVYMDSFFSSVNLYEELKQKGTDTVGTLRSNRLGIPLDLKNAKLKKGESTSMHKTLDGGSSLVCVRFRDKKDLYLLSTKHCGKTVSTGRRHPRTQAEEKKPDVVQDYNENMNAVDQFDQNLAYYAFNRKTMKWWKRALTHLIHISKVQSMILYNMQADKEVTQFNYTLEIVKALTVDVPRLKAPPSDPTLAVRRAGRHYPSRIEQTGKKKNPQKNCQVCTIPKRRKEGEKWTYLHRRETRFECRQCFGVALCVEPCFMVYHEHEDYRRQIKIMLAISD